jgi:purine-nucleoside phosphorylase
MHERYAAFQASTRAAKPTVAVILGSGLANALPALAPVAAIDFSDLPGLPTPSVAGHVGRLLLGQYAGVSVLIMQGRIHYYEGHDWPMVARPIELLAELGVQIVLLTNAAGGIRDDLTPGTLMTITGHQRWNQPGFWRGGRVETVEHVYASQLRAALPPTGGVYVSVTGPSYETAAEVRAMRCNGGDAVGMSTAHEAETAARLGLRVAAVSCITNRAAGLGQACLSHDEVTAVGRQAAAQLACTIENFLRSTTA